jgi:hypothetical protein
MSEKMNDLKKSNLKGSVKEMVEVKYQIIRGDVKNKIEVYRTIVEYNLDGYINTKRVFSHNHTEFIYQFNYDQNKCLREYHKYNKKNELIGKVIYMYNEKGNRVLSAKYNENGKVVDRVTFENKYNREGYLVQIISSQGEKIQYRYDFNMNINEEVNKDSNDVMLTKSKFEYDDLRILYKRTDYHINKGVQEKRTHQYDRNGDEIECCRYRKGEPVFKTVYRYDYDNFYNWIRKYTYLIDNSIQAIEDRKISYYR